jgi:DUF971 family protein
MGNYAYAIAFNDGHRSGIFPLPLLRTLTCPADRPAPPVSSPE